MERNEDSLMKPLLVSSSEHNVTEVIEKINPRNLKRFAILLTLFFMLYHSYIHMYYGKDSCHWLLSDGRFKNDMGWQPYGCMMHVYSRDDTLLCMKSIAFSRHENTFAFLGDQRIHDLFVALKTHFISAEDSAQSDKVNEDPFTNLPNSTFTNRDLRLTLNFTWSPYISQIMEDTLIELVNKKTIPRIIVIGCSLWSIKTSNGSKEILGDYYHNITLLLPIFQQLCRSSRVLWVLQAPVNEEKLNVSHAAITNALIDQYNDAAVKALHESCVEIWSSARLIAQGHLDSLKTGLELSTESLKTDVQLLLNLYCNDHMNHKDGTCCASVEPYTYVQIMAYLVLLCCLLSGGFLLVSPLHCYSSRYSNIQSVIIALAKLSLIMSFFYLCDRTNFFMKENKYYSSISFFLPLGYVFILGLFFTEDSRYTKVMNRDQTDEWKGWMQLVILIFYMTGAKNQLPLYNHILILVAAYLFLTGYGHFMYIWFRSEAGIVRVLQVLFRLNFLTVVLCFCMNRPYQFYSFIPVVTFWVLLLYAVFTFPPRVTSVSIETRPVQYIYVVFKMLFLFVSVSIFYMSEVFFEKVFVTRPWKALFVTSDDDIETWWFHWKIDRFSALFGATFAFLLLLAQKFNLLDDNNHNNLFSPRVSFFAAVLALLGLIATSVYAVICPNKDEFVEIQSYISIVPIVCFILLRNVSGILRTRYSTMFAFFGRISLELFVSHFHIWLSADSNGMLVLVPTYPVVNALIVSYIFVCISHELHCITKKLLPYAVPSDYKLALRNLLIFVVILIPVGIRDGMF
ncbi:hypothetical protein V9T40_002048 [Parthenolecanium corni]|uniref:Cas1p 10 TM acyl transferase domain-containing protein n=1 Tax=Parthenolecanium corni TaxID=536013 RepID=A0AAN9TFW2_9HEMI